MSADPPTPDKPAVGGPGGPADRACVGTATFDRQEVFVLKMIQGRDPGWVNRVFFAKFDPWATWYDQLEPALESSDSLFETSIPAEGEAS